MLVRLIEMIENNAATMAKELKEKTTDPVVASLLEYLIIDEQKHDHLLNQLDAVKRHLSKLS